MWHGIAEEGPVSCGWSREPVAGAWHCASPLQLPQSNWGVSLAGLFVDNASKGSVVSRANSIGSTSASSVPNTGRQQYPPS